MRPSGGITIGSVWLSSLKAVIAMGGGVGRHDHDIRALLGQQRVEFGVAAGLGAQLHRLRQSRGVAIRESHHLTLGPPGQGAQEDLAPPRPYDSYA